VAVPTARSGSPDPSPDGSAPLAEGDPHRREVLVHGRVSGLSGVVFAGLFVAAPVLVRQAPGLGAPDGAYADFYRNTNGNVLVTAALYAVPLAGVALLWQMSTTGTHIGALPRSSPELQRWLHLASGVLFVCMLFAAAAVGGRRPADGVLHRSAAAARHRPFPGRRGLRARVRLRRPCGRHLHDLDHDARPHRGTAPPVDGRAELPVGGVPAGEHDVPPVILLVLPAWVLLFSLVVLLGAGRTRPSATTPPAGPAQVADGSAAALPSPHMARRTPTPAQED
jgi:hypothetical protein